MDIKTRMYVGFGTSFKSEQEAYQSAMRMAKESGIKVIKIRLDRYYSCQAYVESLVTDFGEVTPLIIPKTNATIKGSWQWKKMLSQFVDDTKKYLEDYYQRNQSESGIAEDKKRIGWKLGQKRLDRIDTANTLTTMWHNLYWLG